MNNLNAGAGLYRNDAPAPRVAVRLKGLSPNTRGIGARVEVFGGPVRVQGQEMTCGGRYLSADDTLRVFAATASGREPLRIEVTWRSGRRSRVDGVVAGRLYEIDEAAARAGAAPATTNPGAGGSATNGPSGFQFEDVSARLGHVHVDAAYDDFARQPLLSHRWSQLGPGVAWVASGTEGREDLVVGTGAGGRLTRFRPDGRGGFTREEGPVEERDLTGLALWAGPGGSPVLLVGSANYEEDPPRPGTVRGVADGDLRGADTGVRIEASLGPLAVGDVDGDGDLDVYVGGRMAGGRYPEPVSSQVYTNDGGRLLLDAGRSAALEKSGLASGAALADLDGDGRDELVVAGHWGPVRVWRREGAGWREVTGDWGLNRFRGWWNGITIGDFDGDGRLDLAASNWGRNTPYQSWLRRPVRVYHRDFDGDGVVEMLEAFEDPESGKTVPWRDFETVSRALPFLRGRVAGYRAYGEASLAEMLGDEVEGVSEARVDTLDSMIFLNRGDRFEARALPVEAQFAPAFGIAVADFDGDGAEDLFLAQNFFGVTSEVSRHDAGVGLVLAGDGHGGFRAVEARESGIRLFGEQRGCAVSDFDGDGRVDLAIAQNHGATGLYRNRGGRPGLRVRVEGPPGNPWGLGAVVRARFGGRTGPARHLGGGGGYWSQNSLVTVLATPEPPTAVETRWGGGNWERVEVRPGEREIRITVGADPTPGR